MSYNTPCKKCNDPKPIINVYEITPGKWGIKNLNGSAHVHNTTTTATTTTTARGGGGAGYPQSMQEEVMKAAYPDTAPPPVSTKQERESRAHDIKVAHDENIQATKDKIAALDRNSDACNRVADAINRYCDIKQGIAKEVEAWTDKDLTKGFSLHSDNNNEDQDSFKREQLETEP